jgi:hypothetical protein
MRLTGGSARRAQRRHVDVGDTKLAGGAELGRSAWSSAGRLRPTKRRVSYSGR